MQILINGSRTYKIALNNEKKNTEETYMKYKNDIE